MFPSSGPGDSGLPIHDGLINLSKTDLTFNIRNSNRSHAGLVVCYNSSGSQSTLSFNIDNGAEKTYIIKTGGVVNASVNNNDAKNFELKYDNIWISELPDDLKSNPFGYINNMLFY